MAAPETAVDFSAAMVQSASTLADWLVVLPLVIPMSTGAILVMLRHRTNWHPFIALAGLLALFAVDVALLARVVMHGPAIMMMGSWLPPFGIAFAADLLGATLATVSALIALAVALYQGPVINTHERRYGFYPFLMLLMTGVSGAFLTGDVFNLYVWFEVLLISSFGLLVLGSEPRQIDATVKYGVLNLMATTLFLVATGLLYGTLGTLNMADIAIKARAVESEGPLVTIALLYFVAFGMKAAAFPLNMWLPASYHAPSAGVSALFAGLLTKVGVYSLLKVLVLLLAPQAALFTGLIAVIAAATMIVGALGALAQSDFRRLLNWLVVSGIGAMLVALAVPSPLSLTGAIFYAVHSMVVMAALYLAAGLVEDIAGTGDMRRLGGLWRHSPMLSAVIMVLAFAVAGLPPFSGFWPKAMLVDASLAADAPWLAFAVLASGFLTTLALGRFIAFALWRGGPEGTADGAHDLAHLSAITRDHRLTQGAPLAMLAALVIAIGLVPTPLHDLASGAASGLLDSGRFASAVFGDAR